MKQEIIDRHWMEFIDFYRQLTKELKEKEVKAGDFNKLFEMLTDESMLKAQAVAEMFDTPDEPTFWKWYALVKTKEDK